VTVRLPPPLTDEQLPFARLLFPPVTEAVKAVA
jgi:hypothetical protein